MRLDRNVAKLNSTPGVRLKSSGRNFIVLRHLYIFVLIVAMPCLVFYILNCPIISSRSAQWANP